MLTTRFLEGAQPMTAFSDFVGRHRDRFECRDSNIFAMAWGKVSRRLCYLDLIQNRYNDSSALFRANIDALRKAFAPGSHRITQEENKLYLEGVAINNDVQLQIESFYLFAKIVLDDVARAIEFYFGTARRLALDSHDDLAKRISKYAEAKSLAVDQALLNAIVHLKSRISDFRDYSISHEKSPRTMAGFAYNNTGGGMRIFLTKIYPQEGRDQQVESEELEKLRPALDAYLELVIQFVETNEQKSVLKRVPDDASSLSVKN
jgi:hypothetical protein